MCNPYQGERPLNGRRLLLLGALCAAGLAGAILLYRADPGTSRGYPPCMFHLVSGGHCPGCGATRAAHRLLHGDLRGALRMNALAVAALPFVAYWAARSSLGWLGWAVLPRLPRRAWVGWVVLALVVAFGVLRNLPFEPFCHLAPPD